jgi:hypothetical protein
MPAQVLAGQTTPLEIWKGLAIRPETKMEQRSS